MKKNKGNNKLNRKNNAFCKIFYSISTGMLINSLVQKISMYNIIRTTMLVIRSTVWVTNTLNDCQQPKIFH